MIQVLADYTLPITPNHIKRSTSKSNARKHVLPTTTDLKLFGKVSEQENLGRSLRRGAQGCFIGMRVHLADVLSQVISSHRLRLSTRKAAAYDRTAEWVIKDMAAVRRHWDWLCVVPCYEESPRVLEAGIMVKTGMVGMTIGRYIRTNTYHSSLQCGINLKWRH